MDREDFQVDAVPDGWHVNGFLNTVTGAKLKSRPRLRGRTPGQGRHRSGSERRVQGLDDLCDSILANGLPSDKGVRPAPVGVRRRRHPRSRRPAGQERRREALHGPRTHARDRTSQARRPRGHRPQPAHALPCVSDFTAFLMKDGGGHRQAQVLNAGTAKYQPNLLQRRAVLARQKGVCATPGCNHTHLQIHHTIFWSHGGPTDLDLLIGLCVRCHHLLHRGDSPSPATPSTASEFTNHHGRSLRKRRRSPYRQAA